MNPFFILYLAFLYLYTPFRRRVKLHNYDGRGCLESYTSTYKPDIANADQHFQPISIISMMKQPQLGRLNY